MPLFDMSRQTAALESEILAALARVCRSGRFVMGPECNELEASLASYCGTPHAVACASGSDALLLALMAAEIGPGDEVILPSYTFFATASAVTRLVDLGLEPFMVGSALVSTVAIRLVRTLCTKCREPYEADAATLNRLGGHARTTGGSITLYRGRGCPACSA